MSFVLVGPVVLCANVVSGMVFGLSKGLVGSSSIGILYSSTMIGLTITWL